MDTTSPKILWRQPWNYAEGCIVVIGIILTGIALQLATGNIKPELFSWPVNSIAGVLFVVLIVGIWFSFHHFVLVKWLAGVHATVTAGAGLLAVVLIMGLTPQFAESVPIDHIPSNLFRVLGFYQLTTSWIFILLCFYLLFVLGMTIMRRTSQRQSWRDIGFYLNHLGLFIALLGGILGSADLQRLKMSVDEGSIEWRAVDHRNTVHELPLAIELDTFRIEEYPPKLVVIDNSNGKIQPERRPESVSFEAVAQKMSLAGYSVEIIDYLPHAAIVRDTNIVNFVAMPMEGAATALQVRVTAPSLSAPVEGWVSNGSYLFPYQVLYIDKDFSIAMPVQEVKKYTSKVTIYTQDEHVEKTDIEVNKPFSINNWMIYQLSYDERKGKYSETSIFELVHDRWMKVVYTGIFMLLAGAVYLFIAGPRKHQI